MHMHTHTSASYHSNCLKSEQTKSFQLRKLKVMHRMYLKRKRMCLQQYFKILKRKHELLKMESFGQFMVFEAP